MSMNQYMHPRNIYKQPPNFKQLALEYSDFRKHVTIDLSGKVIVDFKNLEALRALTCTLLKKDFGLDVELPLTKLIPTIPLRLNYILWIEDLLNLAGGDGGIKGIDIGTGASCIYPLLGAKTNKWTMLATEINQESIDYAVNNIKRNNLEGFIKVVKSQGETLLDEVLQTSDGEFDFCMCNPPFFATVQELDPFFKARKQNRPHPKNAFCASVDEVVAKGGEVEYITKLINESKKYSKKVKIFSSMIGHKSSLPPLKKLLREIDVVSFKQTEFCQGYTTRWGLAWTFYDIDLTKIPDSLIAAKQKLPKPLYYQVPTFKKVSCVYERLTKILQDLQIEFEETKHVNNFIEFVIVAYTNTWSHQRRKKREKSKQQSNSSDISERLAELEFGGTSPQKRPLDDDEDCGFYNVKRLKTGTEESGIYLKAKITIMKVDSSVALEMVFFEGSGNKEALHQVLQYIKNNLLKDEETN